MIAYAMRMIEQCACVTVCDIVFPPPPPSPAAAVVFLVVLQRTEILQRFFFVGLVWFVYVNAHYRCAKVRVNETRRRFVELICARMMCVACRLDVGCDSFVRQVVHIENHMSDYIDNVANRYKSRSTLRLIIKFDLCWTIQQIAINRHFIKGNSIHLKTKCT